MPNVAQKTLAASRSLPDFPAALVAAMETADGALARSAQIRSAIDRAAKQVATAKAEKEAAAVRLTDAVSALSLETDPQRILALEKTHDEAGEAETAAVLAAERAQRLTGALAATARDADDAVRAAQDLLAREATVFRHQVQRLMADELREALQPFLRAAMKACAIHRLFDGVMAVPSFIDDAKLPAPIHGEQPLLSGDRAQLGSPDPVSLAVASLEDPASQAIRDAGAELLRLTRAIKQYRPYRPATEQALAAYVPVSPRSETEPSPVAPQSADWNPVSYSTGSGR